MDLDWENLRLFACLWRTRSFSAAAKVVGVDATTLSRRLGQLEDQLGAVLFQRTTAGLVPTEAAIAIAERVGAIERQVQLVREEAAGKAALAEGVVRIAVTEEFAETFLVAQLLGLREGWPGIDLELLVSDANVDLSRGEADLAIRFQYPGRGAPSDPRSTVEITARKVASMHVGVYASRDYLARRGTPASADEIDGHDLVLARGDRGPLPGTPWMARVRGRGRAVLRTDGLGSLRAGVVAGLGIGAVSTFLASQHPELVRISPELTVDEREVWLLAPADLLRVERVRVVWDYVVALAEGWTAI